MKKILFVITIIALVICSLTACGKPNNYYDLYNKETFEEYNSIETIASIKFDVLQEHMNNTKTQSDLKLVLLNNTDAAKSAKDIFGNTSFEIYDKNQFCLINYSQFIYKAEIVEKLNSFYFTKEDIELLVNSNSYFDDVKISNTENITFAKYKDTMKIIAPIIFSDNDLNINFSGFLTIIENSDTCCYFINAHSEETFNEEKSLFIAKSLNFTNKPAIHDNENAFALNLSDISDKIQNKENTKALKDFCIILNDLEISLPIKYEDFKAKTHFAIVEANIEQIIPAKSTLTSKVQFGSRTLTAIFANSSDKEIKIEEATVVGIRTHKTELYDNVVNSITKVVLPNNILIWNSKYEDIVKAYGEPTTIIDTETTQYKTIVYKLGKFESDIYTKLELTFDKENENKLYSLEYTNLKIE